MSCGTTHKKPTTKIASKKPRKKAQRKPMTLAQRRAISASLKCHNAAHGTCKKTKRAKARHHSTAWYKSHGYHKVTTCRAVQDGYHRSIKVTPRNTAHARRLLMHEIRHAQHLGKLKEGRYLVHMGWVAEKHAVHAHKAAAAKAKPRPRNHHASRVSCHTAWRRVHSTAKPRTSHKCPKRKSRLDGK